MRIKQIKLNINYLEANLSTPTVLESKITKAMTVFGLLYILSQLYGFELSIFYRHCFGFGLIPYSIAMLSSMGRNIKESFVLLYRGTWPSPAPEHIFSAFVFKMGPKFIKYTLGGFSLVGGTNYIIAETIRISPLEEAMNLYLKRQDIEQTINHFKNFERYQNSSYPPYIQDNLKNIENLRTENFELKNQNRELENQNRELEKLVEKLIKGQK